MAHRNSTKIDNQDSSSPSLELENHPQGNDNDTLLPTQTLKTAQENECAKSDTRTFLHGMVLGPDHDEDAASAEPIDVEHAHARDTTEEYNGRERLKRHRVEVAGRVWIPDIWGQEDLLKDWADCSVFEASLASSVIMSARAALVNEGKRANSNSLSVGNRC